jgi:acetyl-CoA carboxylase alpha subunit
VIEEPNGGAHRDRMGAIESMGKALEARFGPLVLQDFTDPKSKVSRKIKEDRFQKFRKMGEFAFVPLQSGLKS